MPTLNQRVSTVKSESDRIGHYLATLSAAFFSKPNPCKGRLGPKSDCLTRLYGATRLAANTCQ